MKRIGAKWGLGNFLFATKCNTLFLWNRNHLDYPVNSFFGHNDVILDFGWKGMYSSLDECKPEQFQLVRTKGDLV